MTNNEKQTKEQKEIILLKKCMKEKDERITRIEERWDIAIFCSIIIGLFWVVVAFIWNIGHILNKLPPLLKLIQYDATGHSRIIIDDWFLLLGFWALVIFAVIGFLAILWVLYNKA